MSRPIFFIVFLFFFFFFLIKSNADEYTSRIASRHCPSSTCKNGKFNVSYPFWRIDNSLVAECGYPGLGINCSNPDPNYPLLYISDRDFLVKNINYADNSISVVDADVTSNKECPRPRHNFTLPGRSPLRYNTSRDLNLTFYFNCTNPLANAYPVDCLRSEQYTSYLYVGAANPNHSDWFRICEDKVETTVMETERLAGNDELWWIRNYGGAMSNGFVLNWKASEECGSCEISMGLCGKAKQSGELLCFCGSRTVTRDSCFIEGKNFKAGMKIGFAIGGAALGPVVLCIILFAYLRGKKGRPGNEPDWQRSRNCCGRNKGIFLILLQKRKVHRNVEVLMEQYGPLAPKIYSYSDIKKMTSFFKFKLGQGGYGEVYKANLIDGRLVAIKILNSTKGNGEEFINEVVSISRTSHVNIVNLLGFCYHGTKRALIYEFMPNGSLERYIHGKTPHLGWDKLYKIALGIARGLEYLHKGCNTRIVHFDIKPHNILLDQDFCPKISDFGLAKLYSNNESTISVFGARGTIGYIAPEVVSKNFGRVSYKSDVYSYGMMVLEMVGGRKNINDKVSQSSEIYFPHWAYQRLLLDEDLKLQGVRTEEEEEIAKKMILIGFWCIQTDPSDRPSMNKVGEMLVSSLEKLKMPPKPFLYSSSYSDDISATKSPPVPLHSPSPSCTISMSVS